MQTSRSKAHAADTAETAGAPPAAPHPRGRRGRRLARWLAVFVASFLAALYPLYLAAGHVLLTGDRLERMINRRPERLLVRYEKARTVVPGVFHIEGFEIRGQSRTVQWWASVDRGTIAIDLPKLMRREFHALRIDGTGVDFRLRRRLDAPRRKKRTPPALAPEIPGLSNPPERPPERLYPRRKRDPWVVRLPAMELGDVRRIWIEDYRFEGEAEAAGGFAMELRRRVVIRPSRLAVHAGHLARGDVPLVVDVTGDVEATIEPFSPRETKGWDVLQLTTGRARLRGEAAGLGFIEEYMRKARWTELAGGRGPVEADLRLERGELLPGSRLEARPENAVVRLLDYAATGSGVASWQIEEDGEERTARLALAFDDFTIQRRGYPRPHVAGSGLTIAATGPPPRLPDLLSPTAIALELPPARVPELAFYNAYLPQKTGLAVESGSGTIRGRLAASAPQWIGSGELALVASGVVARYETARLKGDLAIRTRVPRADFDGRSFDLSGSDVMLKDVVVLDAPILEAGRRERRDTGPWWGRLYVERGRLEPGRPVFLRAELEATLKDASPVIAVFGPRRRAVRWLDRVLDAEGVGATAGVTLGEDLVLIDDLAIAGGQAAIVGRIRIAPPGRHGALLLSWGRLAAGLELDGQDRDWKLLRPRRWYESYPAF